MANLSQSLEHLFFRRPRVLNLLHSWRIVRPTSQTAGIELAALERYAAGARQAVEIGTYQGVSAVHIARRLAPGGVLHCVDPWPESPSRPNACWSICRRHLQRSGVEERIAILRGYSQEVQHLIPKTLDFAFIDGDHSRQGIETDWKIISDRMRPGAVVCLHDSVVPQGEEWQRHDSCEYFEQVIRRDPRFTTVEVVRSMAVLKRQ
jgi:predicted O-methyltransferase YrrM